VVIKYCMRLIEQSKMKPISESGGVKTRTAASVGQREFPEIALYEAVRLLDLICKFVPSQVSLS